MDRTMTTASSTDRNLLKLGCFIVFPPFYFAPGGAQNFRIIIPQKNWKGYRIYHIFTKIPVGLPQNPMDRFDVCLDSKILIYFWQPKS